MENKSPEELESGIRRCCSALKLSQRLADNILATGTASQQEYVYELFTRELDCRKVSRLDKEMSGAGLPSRFEMEDFDFSDVVLDNNLTLEDLTSLRFFHNRENLIMFGNSGTGKTMLSIILGTMIVRTGATVRFFRSSALIKLLSAKKLSGKLDPFLESLKKADALILDEWGYVSMDDYTGAMLLFDFISEVYMTTTIILNTNLEFSQWDIVFQNKKLTDAFLGRVMANANVLLFNGNRYSFKGRKDGDIS